MVKLVMLSFFVVQFISKLVNAAVIIPSVEMMHIRGGNDECNNRFIEVTDPGDPSPPPGWCPEGEPCTGDKCKDDYEQNLTDSLCIYYEGWHCWQTIRADKIVHQCLCVENVYGEKNCDYSSYGEGTGAVAHAYQCSDGGDGGGGGGCLPP